LQKVEESNKDKFNKKQLADAFNLFGNKNKKSQEENSKGVMPLEAEHVEIPEVL